MQPGARPCWVPVGADCSSGFLAAAQANQRARAGNSRRRLAVGGRGESARRSPGQPSYWPWQPSSRGCTAGGLRRSGPGSASSRSPDRKASAAIWWLRYCRCGIRACRACRHCTCLHPEALQPHHIVSSVHAATSRPDRESSGRRRKRASPRRSCVQWSVHRDGRQAWYAPAK